MFERKNERLKSVELLKDTLCSKKGRYYLGLTYEFEDAQENVHEVYISRVPLPIYDQGIPEIKCKSVYTMGSYINAGASIDVGYGDVDLPGDYTVIDTIVKYAPPKEMTLEEIEKKLGYKVKIVSREDE